MTHKTLGSSDFKVSQITFGAWAIGGWMWGGADDKDALDALSAAIDAGITTIDTAAVYGFGHSERLVGHAIKGKRDKLQILTKYGLQWEDTKGQYYFKTFSNEGKPLDVYKYASKDSVIKECEISLKNLGTDYIDLYQIHWPDATTPIQETMEAIDILKKQGKIRYAGVCNFDTQLLNEALKYFPLLSDQVPYSMVNRHIEEELIPYSRKNNIGILAYSPLQRGILTGKMYKGYKFNHGDTRPMTGYYREPNFSLILDFVDTLRPIAKKYKASVGQVVINWTLQQPGITSALVGARDKAQVLDNVRALDFSIIPEDMEVISKSLKNLQLEK